MVAFGVGQVLGSVINMNLIDRCGRRLLLLSSSLLVSICLYLMTFYFVVLKVSSNVLSHMNSSNLHLHNAYTNILIAFRLSISVPVWPLGLGPSRGDVGLHRGLRNRPRPRCMGHDGRDSTAKVDHSLISL